jgi:hypothetical protein
LYAEILLKLREVMLPKAKYSFKLLQEIEKIEKQFDLTEEMVASDFTARLEIVVKKLVNAIKASNENTRGRLTNILFEGEIPQLRESIVRLSSDFDSITVLFDNIDKGWPTGGLEKTDIRTIRHLIDRLSRIQHELAREDIRFQHLVFLRSDVYDELVEETSDRGKYNPIRIDWTDPLQLEHLIKRRVWNSVAVDVEGTWSAFNTRMPDGRSAMQTMIQSCLMRPRFLIDLCENALSFAINRGHQSLTESDVNEALEQHSIYLVSYFGYEMRDISGLSEDIFLKFLGHGQMVTEQEVTSIVQKAAPETPPEKIIHLLMWYGFLGIRDENGADVYIYDRQYDIRRLEAERRKQGEDILFVINPAFLRGLH